MPNTKRTIVFMDMPYRCVTTQFIAVGGLATDLALLASQATFIQTRGGHYVLCMLNFSAN